MAADEDLFASLDAKDLDRVDLIDFASEDLGVTPSPPDSPHTSISCR